jgi:diguanylate cyclase (GGDEF)-like protein
VLPKESALATSSKLIDGVAATTSIWDRDSLDHSIARLLLRFVDAHSVTLYRLVVDGHVKRLACRVTVEREFSEARAASAVAAADDAARLTLLPAWQECIDRDEIVQYPGPEDRTVTLFPIPGERECVGALAIDAAGALPKRSAELVRGILRIFRNHLALLDYGELDTLTGLLNRKTFESHFEKVRLRLMRNAATKPAAEASWLALLDIDRFKTINDSHGHLVGDEILLLVSQIMKRSFRGADQLFRFGGEEFVVVLDQASDAGARIAIERLRTAVEEYIFPQIGRVTLSAGYTRIVPHDIPTTCVERADAALYYAKSHGRNNVRNFEVLVAAGELSGRHQTGAIDLF